MPATLRNKAIDGADAAFALDRALLFDLADAAIDAGRRSGADYVDIRLVPLHSDFDWLSIARL